MVEGKRMQSRKLTSLQNEKKITFYFSYLGKAEKTDQGRKPLRGRGYSCISV